MAIFRQPSAICYNLILVAFDWLFSAVNFDLFPLITCIVTLVAYVWMFTTVCFQMSSLSYRSVGGGACFWTGGCQDHLVCFHLLAILTGQGDISKVLGSLNWPKKKFQIIWLHLLAGCWWLLQMKQAVMILWITWAVWEEPPTPLCQGPPRHFLIQPSNLKEEKPLCTWLVPLVDVDCTKVGFQLAPDVPTWSQPSRSLSLSTPCLWSPPLPPTKIKEDS